MIQLLVISLHRYLGHAEMILPMVEASGPDAINRIRTGIQVYKKRLVVNALG